MNRCYFMVENDAEDIAKIVGRIQGYNENPVTLGQLPRRSCGHRRFTHSPFPGKKENIHLVYPNGAAHFSQHIVTIFCPLAKDL